MADFVVRLTGKDELSGTLNKVKQELNQTGDAGSRLDQIRDRFNKITSSSAPLKKQLREIQGMMAQMNLEGLDRSDVFAAMAAKAGEYKDAIGDAAQATRLLSSDTSNLDALMGGLSAISSAASIATGVMGLFGTENENVQQAILRVQSALSILSGVQELSNALNKDSILVLKGQQIWEAIKAAVTKVDTAAIRENTNATGLNTLAQVASRLAQQAWNVVKAIGKALLGDFTGLLLVGAGALVTYTLATKKSAGEQDNLNQSTKAVSNTFANTYSNSLAQTMTKYQLLRKEFLSLKSEHQRIEWIKNNQSAFQELGLSVYSVTDAENVFINNTDRMVKAFKARAEAEAAQEVAMEYRKKAIKARLDAEQADENVTKQKQDEAIRQGMRDALHGNVHKVKQQKYISTGPYATKKRKEADENDRRADKAEDFANQKKAEANELYKPKSGGGSSRNTPRTTPRNTSRDNITPPSKEEVIPEGSIKWYNEEISKLRAKIELSVDPNERATLQREIDDYKLEIDNIKFEINKINFNDAVIAKGIKDNTLKDTNEALSKQLSNIEVPPIEVPPISEEFDKLSDTLSGLGGTFGDISSKWVDLAKLFEDGANSTDKAGNGLVTLGQSLQAIGGNGAVAKVGAVMAAIGQIILGFTAAAASPAVTSTGWGWLAFVGAGMAAVTTMISTIKGFSTGGIIQGGQIAGDQMLARVNAGEMILNGSQQKNLFNLLDSGGALAGSGNSKVEFKISGSSLKGVLRNYDSKMNKIR